MFSLERSPDRGVWSMQTAAHEFQAHMVRETLSPNTIQHYMHDIRLYCRFMENLHGEKANKIPATAVTRESLTAFLDEQRTKRNNKDSSVRRRLSCLRKFVDFLHDSGVVPHRIEIEVALSDGRTQPDPPHGLTPVEEAALLDAVRTIAPDPERDYCLFLLFLRCGLNLGEVLRLRVEDVDLATSTLRVTGKNDVQRPVPLALEVNRALAAYLKKRENKSSRALFLNRWQEPITKGAVDNVLRKMRSVPALRKTVLNVTRLRNTAILDKVSLGWSPETLASYLGAEDPRTLERYYAHARWSKQGSTPPYAALRRTAPPSTP